MEIFYVGSEMLENGAEGMAQFVMVTGGASVRAKLIRPLHDRPV